MAFIGWLVVLIAAAALVISYLWYAAMIRRRNTALAALSSIDVYLRRRHDLLPNVLKLADRFMSHERDLLARITELRNRAQRPYDPGRREEVRDHLDQESSLQSGLRQLFAVAENYPELRSSDTVIEAQHSFNAVEGDIAAARRTYNAAVSDLNDTIQIWPGSIIAVLAGIQTMPFFEVTDETVRQPIDADAYLNLPETSSE